MPHPVDLSLAASDAQYIVQASQEVTSLIAGQVTTRRILLLLDKGIFDAITRDYDLKHPEAVLEIFQSSALARAVSSTATVAELRDELLTRLLPILDIFVKIEEENAKRSKTVPRDGADPETELGTPIDGAGTSEELRRPSQDQSVCGGETAGTE